MKALLKFVLLWAVLMRVGSLQGQPICSFKEIESEIDSVRAVHRPEDVLVLFDVNYTLLFVDHPAMYIPNIKQHPIEMQVIMQGLSKEEQNIVIGLATKAEPQRVVEESIPGTIQRIKNSGVKVLALSAALSGMFCGLDSEEWFYSTLKSFDIDFSSSFQNIDSFTFNDFPLYNNSLPTYNKGIVLTNKCDKGAVLVSFLKRTGYHPKMVVLVDNKKANIEEMEATLKAFDPQMGFMGLNYSRGQEYAPQNIDGDSFLKWWRLLPFNLTYVGE